MYKDTIKIIADKAKGIIKNVKMATLSLDRERMVKELLFQLHLELDKIELIRNNYLKYFNTKIVYDLLKENNIKTSDLREIKDKNYLMDIENRIYNLLNILTLNEIKKLEVFLKLYDEVDKYLRYREKILYIYNEEVIEKIDKEKLKNLKEIIISVETATFNIDKKLKKKYINEIGVLNYFIKNSNTLLIELKNKMKEKHNIIILELNSKSVENIKIDDIYYQNSKKVNSFLEENKDFLTYFKYINFEKSIVSNENYHYDTSLQEKEYNEIVYDVISKLKALRSRRKKSELLFIVILILLLYSIFSFDQNGFNKLSINKNTYSYYDEEGYNKRGYDREGYDSYGYDKKGYDREGYDSYGFDKKGHDRGGYNSHGYNKEGYDRKGYNKEGYNREGYDQNGNYDWGHYKNRY